LQKSDKANTTRRFESSPACRPSYKSTRACIQGNCAVPMDWSDRSVCGLLLGPFYGMLDRLFPLISVILKHTLPVANSNTCGLPTKHAVSTNLVCKHGPLFKLAKSLMGATFT
ncbi:hypothetical protein NDU88_006760, partial [Pleurodeles waltl]